MKKIFLRYKNASAPFKATFWYAICNFVNRGIALITTPIFTRVLTEEQYGQYINFQSWFNIIFIFTSLNIFMGGYQKGLLKFRKDEKRFTSSQLGLTTAITLFFAVVYCVNIDFWTNIFSIPPALMFVMFLELITQPAFEFWCSRERFDYKYKKVVLLTVLVNVLSVAIGIAAILMTDFKTEARVVSDVATKVLIAAPLFVLIWVKGKKIFHKVYWKYALSFNLPLIPHYLSHYILNQSDRIMINKMVGSAQTAYYNIAYTVSVVLTLLMSAINNALTPFVYRALEDKKTDKIAKSITPVTVLFFALSVVLMAFAPEIIYIFAGDNYMEAIYVMPPVIAAVYFMFVYMLYSIVEYYYQKTKLIAVATSVSAIANIVLNYIGIKIFGYYAAGYTTLICYALLAIMHYVFYKKILKDRKRKSIYNDVLNFGLGVTIILICVICSLIYGNIALRYSAVGLVFVFGILFRRKIIESFNCFRSTKK